MIIQRMYDISAKYGYVCEKQFKQKLFIPISDILSYYLFNYVSGSGIQIYAGKTWEKHRILPSSSGHPLQPNYV